MEKLLLVDGSNLLFQMFYGMPARIVNDQGKAIQGTLGFTGALLKIIRLVNPTHLAVLFDGEHPLARADIDPGYKANRTDYAQLAPEETPFSQIDDVYAALDELQICHAETTLCETDDWMAGYVHACSHRFEMVIASFDSDFFQLISENVSVLRYRGKSTAIWTPETVMRKCGVLPQQYADWKALTGDAADNIRGAAHIGPKTAAALLKQFGSLPQLLAKTECIERPRIRESILQSRERLQQNLRLIRLSGGAPLPFLPEELRWQDHGLTTVEVLRLIGLK